MVFKNNFVAVVKCNGKILREQGEYVTLPFGSEYSILLKNLEARKAVVSINIDGKDALNGRRLIVQANSELELKGFKKDGLVRNKFKFIQKTKEISDHLGDKIDDGMIRVEVTYEQQVTNSTKFETTYRYNWPLIWPWEPRFSEKIVTWGTSTTSIKCNSAPGDIVAKNSVNCFMSTSSSDSPSSSSSGEAIVPKYDEGITVKGSEVNQKFVPATTKTLEDISYVIVIRLKGVTDIGKVVKKAVTVKTKLTCETCGKKNKSNIKYCPNCGTYL